MENDLTDPITNKDHIRGDLDAPVKLVEYGDYQCPYCRQAFPIIKQIRDKYGNQLVFVFRNFPLPQHPDAYDAAMAAEAAGVQGKYWEMHDKLFENQDDLSPMALENYAREVGLEVAKFIEDKSSPDLANKVENDMASGEASGVMGTPTFFINGRRYEGESSFESLSRAIDEIL